MNEAGLGEPSGLLCNIQRVTSLDRTIIDAAQLNKFRSLFQIVCTVQSYNYKFPISKNI